MFALVQFLVDKVKAVVKVTDIKNFNNDQLGLDWEVSGVHEVFWKSPSGDGSGYYYAVVLLVADTEELIEQRKKRVKFPSPKKLDELLASTLIEGKKNKNDEETRRKTKEVIEKRNYCEKEKLSEILKKRLKSKRCVAESDDELMEASTSKRISSFPHIESSDDELVLKSEINIMQGEYKKILKKYKIQQEEIKKLKKTSEKLQELNIKLQTQLLSFLNKSGDPECSVPEIVSTALNNLPMDQNVKGCSLKKNLPQSNLTALSEASIVQKAPIKIVEENAGGYSFAALSEASIVQNAPIKIVEVNAGVSQQNHQISSEIMLDRLKTEEEVSPIQLSNSQGLYLHDNGKLFKWEDGKMELAPGIPITNDQWEKVTKAKNMNPSKFTRNMAVSLWGSETLKKRSVTGMPCRRYKKQGVKAKEGLTPMKLDAVQNGLRFFLKNSQGKEEKEVLALSSPAAVKKMISDKIMDLNKQEKKNLKFEL